MRLTLTVPRIDRFDRCRIIIEMTKMFPLGNIKSISSSKHIVIKISRNLNKLNLAIFTKLRIPMIFCAWYD